jgi:hypothetical protein
MSNLNLFNDTDNNNIINSNNDNFRNIVINKKDKKGNKKRQINFSNDTLNQNIGINILKDDYEIKIDDTNIVYSEMIANDESSNISETDIELKNEINNELEDIVEIDKIPENSILVLDEVDNTTVAHTIVDNTTVDNTTVDNTTVDNTTVDNTTVDNTTVDNTTVDNTTVDNTTVDNIDNTSYSSINVQSSNTIKVDVIDDKVEYNNLFTMITTQYDTCKDELNSMLFKYKKELIDNHDNKSININIMDNRLTLSEIKIKNLEDFFCMDLTIPFNEYNGSCSIVYANDVITKYDIVELHYAHNKFTIKPISYNNNNFYGIALNNANAGEKVNVLIKGICRVRINNIITLPLMKHINGKTIMLQDQKKNYILQQMSLNINNGDLLIPMKIADDLIAGPSSIYAQFNNNTSTCMIPFKNIIFNNMSLSFSASHNNKSSVGLRFAYVLDNTIVDNTILVSI